jgi:hypothetical protein
MRKHRAKLFLALLILSFFVLAYKKLRTEPMTIKQMIDHTDSLVNNGDQPQFNKAFNYMDSCFNVDEDLLDDSSFRVRYERLDNIVH